MERKKILVFAVTAGTSGISQYVLNLAGGLSDQYRFDFVSMGNGRLKRWAKAHGTQYHELNVSLYKHPVQYKKLLRRIFLQGYDAVHFHVSSVTDLRQFHYAKQCGIPLVIVHSHSTQMDMTDVKRRKFFTAVHKMKRNRLARLADVLCACSRSAAEWLFGPQAAQNAVILHNAIDIPSFIYKEEIRVQQRRQLGLEGAFVVGHIGRFAYSKNHEFLLAVFGELVKIRPEAKLLLIGTGETKKNIQGEILRLNLQEAVNIFDFAEKPAPFYQAMDCFALPSRFEALPLTLIEAQACGLPCFASAERVSPEAAVTSLCFLPLEDGPAVWAAKIAAVDIKNRRSDPVCFQKAGYALDTQLEILRSLYHGKG